MKNCRPLQMFVVLASLALASSCERGPTGDQSPPPSSDKAAAAKPVDKAAAAKPVDKAPVDKAAKPADKPAKLEGKVYGGGVKLAESTAISTIVDSPKDYEGKTVRVEGMITDVCAKRGCWMAMAGDKPGQTMRFKVKDGVMVFPMTEKGKYAVAEGKVVVNELSMEETKKYAAYDAEERGVKFDPSTVTEPKTLVRLAGTGSVVRDSK